MLRDLRETEGGDVYVVSSASLIKDALAADLVDRYCVTQFPVTLGAGPRLFDGGLPEGRWTLARQVAGENGELCLAYDRVR